ncbi:hypothetical protein [Catellatospora sichuanensis]|nr:hypothetical protein [Catellatospora sichuanensis]
MGIAVGVQQSAFTIAMCLQILGYGLALAVIPAVTRVMGGRATGTSR